MADSKVNATGSTSLKRSSDTKNGVNDVKRLKRASKCPFHTKKMAAAQLNWWPNQLNFKSLQKGTPKSMDDAAAYKEKFLKLNLDELKQDVINVMTTSQPWWPADYGHYGPFFVRMTWHSAGTYRTFDGRGGGATGNLRFAPLNSWPDNTNLDKARRLLWPIKKKYGQSLSWGDLMIFAGNCAIESMGLETFGFGGGRIDGWEPEDDIYWGSEKEWLAADRYNPSGAIGDALDQPLGAVQMGLIYVNPEGPGGNADPLQSAQDIRTTFGRMAMNEEETVSLIAGGHTFGKGHGAADPNKHVGPNPESSNIEAQGFGWENTFESGAGPHTITSGLEGAWTANPISWDNGYFENLFKYEWELAKTPAGAQLWVPKDKEAHTLVPDAHDKDKKHPPVMFTSDMALKLDPIYGPISKRFLENPQEFAETFKRAWYKLTHRDMGPVTRLLGSKVPEPQIWQDHVPQGETLTPEESKSIKDKLLALGIPPGKMVRTAWASAVTFRRTDYRGGANGARLRLEPQRSWACNDPEELAGILAKYTEVKNEFSKASMADIIVLGGCAGIEAAADAAGVKVEVPFTSGRGDATDEMTDAASFAVLEPRVDGFRNFFSGTQTPASAESSLIDKAHMLGLTKAEMVLLVGGFRVIGANAGNSDIGVLTNQQGKLTNDFFVNLLDMSYKWKPSAESEHIYEACDRTSGEVKWRGSRVDLVIGSNSELRAIAEFYACDDAQAMFVKDFAEAFSKVMNLDRFDM